MQCIKRIAGEDRFQSLLELVEGLELVNAPGCSSTKLAMAEAVWRICQGLSG